MQRSKGNKFSMYFRSPPHMPAHFAPVSWLLTGQTTEAGGAEHTKYRVQKHSRPRCSCVLRCGVEPAHGSFPRHLTQKSMCNWLGPQHSPVQTYGRVAGSRQLCRHLTSAACHSNASYMEPQKADNSHLILKDFGSLSRSKAVRGMSLSPMGMVLFIPKLHGCPF